jgi:hypothetical protein
MNNTNTHHQGMNVHHGDMEAQRPTEIAQWQQSEQDERDRGNERRQKESMHSTCHVHPVRACGAFVPFILPMLLILLPLTLSMRLHF